MLTQYAFSILFIDKKKAKFSNDRFGFNVMIVVCGRVGNFRNSRLSSLFPRVETFHEKRERARGLGQLLAMFKHFVV